MIQQINHGISTGALFLIVGILYERRHTREISEYGGISNIMPVYATIALIMFMSSMGLPLLNGFVGEFTILQGTFMENKIWAAWAVPGVILAAAYLLWLYQRVFFGKNENPKNANLKDLSAREIGHVCPAGGAFVRNWHLSQAAVPDSGDADQQPSGDGAAGLSGLTKPVVAAQPANTAQPDAAAPLPEPSKAPVPLAPTNQTGASGHPHVHPLSKSRSSLFALRLSQELQKEAQ